MLRRVFLSLAVVGACIFAGGSQADARHGCYRSGGYGHYGGGYRSAHYYGGGPSYYRGGHYGHGYRSHYYGGRGYYGGHRGHYGGGHYGHGGGVSFAIGF